MPGDFFSDVGEPDPHSRALGRPIRSPSRSTTPDRLVLGRRMEDHLRIAVCLWHSFNWPGSDVFGAGTFDRPWLAAGLDPMEAAATKVDAAFEFIAKLGRPVLHASTIATSRPRARTFAETQANLDAMVTRVERAHGADRRRACCGAPRTCSATRATRPAPRPTPIRRSSPSRPRRSSSMLEATHRLGGANYVLWGGREGYETLLNTDLRREERAVRALPAPGGRAQAPDRLRGHAPHRAEAAGADQAPVRLRRGDGPRLPRPPRPRGRVPREPRGQPRHPGRPQLPSRGRVRRSRSACFGSIDVNRGDYQNGWDTDQFPNSVDELVARRCYEILRGGGFTSGGFNFDTKLRRQSMRSDRPLPRPHRRHGHAGAGAAGRRRRWSSAARSAEPRTARYAGWDGELGQRDPGRRRLARGARATGSQRAGSTRSRYRAAQELLENAVNQRDLVDRRGPSARRRSETLSR